MKYEVPLPIDPIKTSVFLDVARSVKNPVIVPLTARPNTWKEKIKLICIADAIILYRAIIGTKKPIKKNPKLFKITIFNIWLKSGVKRVLSISLLGIEI